MQVVVLMGLQVISIAVILGITSLDPPTAAALIVVMVGKSVGNDKYFMIRDNGSIYKLTDIAIMLYGFRSFSAILGRFPNRLGYFLVFRCQFHCGSSFFSQS